MALEPVEPDPRPERPDPRPRSRLTPRVRRDVFVDQAAYRLVRLQSGPDLGELPRIEAEVDEALEMFERHGWRDEPTTYHRDPPAPDGVRVKRRRSGNLRYSSLTWLDQFSPHVGEPGTGRHLARERNAIARAAVLEHRSGDRPWLVCLHGFGMGSPGMDLRVFRALHLYRDLGLNLAFLTLPMHGRRKSGRGAMPEMPGLDVMDTVHGLTQAVWDARQLLAHLRLRTEQPIAVAGLSLGGLVAGVVASVDDVHGALLYVPAVDLPTLMADATAAEDSAEAEVGAALVERARPLYGPVSPLRLDVRVPVDHRFIVAGTLDRFARPSSQAVALWRHWDEPGLHWYHGGHVSLFWARGVQDAVDDVLRSWGLAAPLP